MKSKNVNKISWQEKIKLLLTRAETQKEAGHVRSSFRLTLIAAKMGDSCAQVNVGIFYFDGIGVKPNKKKAFYWNMKAYRNGDSFAANNIAIAYKQERRFKKALEWFLRAINLGDIDCDLEVAKIYIFYLGDIKKAKMYLARAIKNGARAPYDAGYDSMVEARKFMNKIEKSKKSGFEANLKSWSASDYYFYREQPAV